MINLHKSMGPGSDRTLDPWICSQTRICCQTRYRLRYAVVVNGGKSVKIRLRKQSGEGLVFASLISIQESRRQLSAMAGEKC